MKHTKPTLEYLLADQKKFYKENIGWIYPDAKGKSEVWDEHMEDYDELFEDDDPIMADIVLDAMADWHLDQSHYHTDHDNPEQSHQHFAQAAWMWYHASIIRVEVGRQRGRVNSISSEDALLHWSLLVLAGWHNEAEKIIQLVLQSTLYSGDMGFMGKGCSNLDVFPFFLMELSCLSQGTDFNRKDFAHPSWMCYKEPFIYDQVLPHWNTPDLKQVDELVGVMADYHLARTVEQDENTREEDEDHFEFADVTLRLYPFEILVWLEIRRLHGLENPTTFSHPLMNQPLAQPPTDTPLPRPTDLEEVNRILELVKKHYPEAEV